MFIDGNPSLTFLFRGQNRMGQNRQTYAREGRGSTALQLFIFHGYRWALLVLSAADVCQVKAGPQVSKAMRCSSRNRFSLTISLGLWCCMLALAQSSEANLFSKVCAHVTLQNFVEPNLFVIAFDLSKLQQDSPTLVKCG